MHLQSKLQSLCNSHAFRTSVFCLSLTVITIPFVVLFSVAAVCLSLHGIEEAMANSTIRSELIITIIYSAPFYALFKKLLNKHCFEYSNLYN